jgi:hypothetical protein
MMVVKATEDTPEVKANPDTMAAEDMLVVKAIEDTPEVAAT